MSPPQARAYAQSCIRGHSWLKVTETERPDPVCPYCGSADVTSVLAWTLRLPREEPPWQNAST